MIKKILLIFSISLFTFSSFSQEKGILITGNLIDSLGVIKNANVINLKTNKGTFSLDDGSFTMFVSLNDSLRISSIQHQTKIIAITKNIIQTKLITIRLKINTFILDEFNLKRHNLSGRLGIDRKAVPKNIKDSLLRNVMDFSKVNLKKAEKDDYIDQRVRPQIVNTVPNSFEGVGTKIKMPFKDHEGILRRKLAIRKAFPKKLLAELGERFFFVELKIPMDNYFHFLEYCNPLGIEKLHKEEKILELIAILRKESISYLKIIGKE